MKKSGSQWFPEGLMSGYIIPQNLQTNELLRIDDTGYEHIVCFPQEMNILAKIHNYATSNSGYKSSYACQSSGPTMLRIDEIPFQTLLGVPKKYTDLIWSSNVNLAKNQWPIYTVSKIIVLRLFGYCGGAVCSIISIFTQLHRSYCNLAFETFV